MTDLPRIRILFVGNNLRAGGAERQWSILAPALARRGHDVRMLALEAGGPFEAPLQEAGLPYEVLGMRHQLDLLPVLRSPLARRFAPEVVISRSLSGLYVGQTIARLRRAAHVHTDHQQVGLALSRRREVMTRWLAPRVQAIVVVSPDQGQAWRARGCDERLVHYVPNGVPAIELAEPRDAIRAQLGVAPEAILAVSVAAMRTVKRHVDVVSAIRLARERQPQLTALIVGDGPDIAEVAAAAGDDPHTRLLGHRDDVARILTAADVFVLASEFEAAPMAILEAMAAGRPVIATAVGSVPAIVADGQTGILVAPRAPDDLAAALVRLAAEPDTRERMSQAAARTHRERFDVEAMVDGYERVLASVLNSSGAISR